MLNTNCFPVKKSRISCDYYSGSTTEIDESELINVVKNGKVIRNSITKLVR
jgi:hypothetical protein